MTSPLSEGLHEALLTRGLQGALAHETTLLPDLGRVDPEDQVHVLTRHIATAAMRRLAAVRDPAKRLELANQLLGHITDDSQLVIDRPSNSMRFDRSRIPAASSGTPSARALR
jgi:hypothetical protein